MLLIEPQYNEQIEPQHRINVQKLTQLRNHLENISFQENPN